MSECLPMTARNMKSSAESSWVNISLSSHVNPNKVTQYMLLVVFYDLLKHVYESFTASFLSPMAKFQCPLLGSPEFYIDSRLPGAKQIHFPQIILIKLRRYINC